MRTGIRQADELPLPSYPHVPGRNARPVDAPFAAVRALLPSETRDADSAANTPWWYGIRLVEAGFHWEAHEVLEGVWMQAAPNGRERHLVQGLIHLANAALKAGDGRFAAAQRLALRARESIERAFPTGTRTLMGLESTPLLKAAETLRTAGETGRAPERLMIRST